MGGNSTKRLDLTGQRFGMLTVLRRGENIGRDTAWHCRCDCGREVNVRTCYLRKGKTHSCGCDFREDRLEGSKRLDLAGQRFGKLTAVEPLDRGTLTNYRWRCVCDCGGECAATVANLRNGHTQSCGCTGRTPNITFVDGTCIELIRNNTLRSNNSSGVTGVVWQKRAQRWRAEIGFKRKRYFLGLYDRFDDAVKARKEAEAKYFGAFLAVYDTGTYQTAEQV